MGVRQEKIDEQTRAEINEIIRSVKDHRLTGFLINIPTVRVSKDLSIARVYYGIMPVKGGRPSDEDIKRVAQGLKSASSYIRGELARRLNLRITPKLIFEYDDTVEKALGIARALKDIEDETRSEK